MPREQKTQRGLTVLGLILALAMGALEGTVVATVMPTVIGDLGGIEQYAWVANAYLISSSVTVPIYGKLADIYGRKPIMLFGIATFLLGSAASGAAPSMLWLILFRALQGLGAGAMQPTALTIVGDIFDLEERSRMQGVFGAAWGLFGLIGPMLGGFIVQYFSWRWVFYINVPFGLMAAALIGLSLHERNDRRRGALDFAGAALLAGAVVALLAASGGERSTAEFAIPLSAACFVAFILVERSAAEPVLPLALFTRPLLRTASLAGAIIGGAMMGTLTYVPLFVQGVLRGSPTDAGSAITPMVIGWPIASAISGRLIPKVGFRPLVRTGLGVTAASALVLASTAHGDSLGALRAITLSFGVGMGLANTALLIAVQTSVEWRDRGIATASTMFFRTVGGAIAVGLMGGIINAALSRDPSIPEGAASRLVLREGLQGLDPSVLQRLGDALDRGLGEVFWMIAGIAAAGFLVTLWFPNMPLPRDEEAPDDSARMS